MARAGGRARDARRQRHRRANQAHRRGRTGGGGRHRVDAAPDDDLRPAEHPACRRDAARGAPGARADLARRPRPASARRPPRDSSLSLVRCDRGFREAPARGALRPILTAINSFLGSAGAPCVRATAPVRVVVDSAKRAGTGAGSISAWASLRSPHRPGRRPLEPEPFGLSCAPFEAYPSASPSYGEYTRASGDAVRRVFPHGRWCPSRPSFSKHAIAVLLLDRRRARLAAALVPGARRRRVRIPGRRAPPPPPRGRTSFFEGLTTSYLLVRRDARGPLRHVRGRSHRR